MTNNSTDKIYKIVNGKYGLTKSYVSRILNGSHKGKRVKNRDNS